MEILSQAENDGFNLAIKPNHSAMAILKKCLEFAAKAALNFKLFELNDLKSIKPYAIASS